MKLFKLILIWLCILSLFEKIHSQEVYYKQFKVLQSTQDISTATPIIDSLISKAIEVKALDDAGNITSDFAYRFYKNGSYQKAITYALQEVKIREELKKMDTAYSKALYRLAFYYYKNDEFKNSISTHNKVIELGINQTDVAKSYCEIGRNYNRQLDFYKAISYYKNGIILLENQKDYENLQSKYLNLSIVYNTIGTKESHLKSIEVLEKIIGLQKYLEFNNDYLYKLNNAFATSYSQRSFFDFDKAKKYYNKNLKIALKSNDSIKINTLYFNLGNIYNTVKDRTAISYIDKGIAYSQSLSDKVIGLHLLSDYYDIQGELKKALEHIETSIKLNAPEAQFTPSNTHKNKLDLLESLIAKVSILLKLYSKNIDITYAQQALETIILTDKFIDIIQNEDFETASVLHWRNQASELYTQGTYCSKIVNNPSLAFYFIEKNKALLLTQAILKNTKRNKVPKTIVDKEIMLTKTILDLESQLVSNTISKTKKQELTQSLFKKKRIRQSFLDSIKIIYPNYFLTTSNNTIYSLNNVQKQLNENKVIVSYIWNTSANLTNNIYGLLTTKDNSLIFEISEKENIKLLIKNYQKGISKPFDTKQGTKQFQETAYQLYTTLFPTQEIQKIIKNKHLIIVPDNNLQNIPFEAFIIDQNTNTYLIEEAEISYAYSISSLLHNTSTHRETTKDFIGFAPAVFKNNNLDSLPQSISELKTIQSIEKGTAYFRNEATKSTFLKEASDYKVIHLATHADAAQQPWIAFNDEKLELNELYTFYNKAELVVLSGCNTSLGITANGEGVLSLARGFFYSGTNTIISSLRNSNDKSTATIFSQFYKNLNKGQTRSEALRNAKLHYLKTHGLSQASPYYWATFILIGNTDTIPQNNDNQSLYIILVLFLALIIIGMLSRKLKKFPFQG